MEQFYNHLPSPAAPVFTPNSAAPMYQVPVPVFPTASSMPVQQVPLGEFAPAGTFFPNVHTDAIPTLYSNSSSTHHLPYSQMIREAIGTLRERDGSSRQSISKYIERVCPNLPANHWNLMTQHLKRMKDSGELVMVKNSYMLAASPPGVLASLSSENVHMEEKDSPPPKLEEPSVTNYSQAHQAVQESPIKASVVVPGPVPDDLVSLYAAIGLIYDGSLDPAPAPAPVPVPKKGRGRPKKVLGPSNNAPTSPVPIATTDGLPAKRRPGRPPKNAASGAAGGGVISPRGRGRGRGRPRQNAGVYTGKPRGRPRRNVEASASVSGAESINLNDGHVDDGVVAVGRKRGRPGRPPRSANEPQNPRNLSGKPLGRPKKKAPAAVVEVSNLQQLLAYHMLKSKLEFFQSRIKHTVDILKPVILNNIQNASIVSGALQELEELAALDVNVPSSFLGPQHSSA